MLLSGPNSHHDLSLYIWKTIAGNRMKNRRLQPRVAVSQRVILVVLVGVVSIGTDAAEDVNPIQFRHGDRIVILGSTFGERLGSLGYFESLLYTAFPSQRLSLRNLSRSADEVTRVEEIQDLLAYVHSKGDPQYQCFTGGD
jgi:hypothetical protein